MQQSTLYANANIAMIAHEFLLTRERIRRLVAASTRPELLSVLAECGYNTDFPTDDAIIDAERAKTLDTFVSLSTDDNVTFCVTQVSNMTESTVAQTFRNIAPVVLKIKNKSIREYFVTLADLTNVRTFYKQGNSYVAGGVMGTKSLNIYPNREMAEIEDAINARLDRLAATAKDDIFQPNMLFWWFTEKQKEFIAVKTILMNKGFGFNASAIRESLRGLYERFK